MERTTSFNSKYKVGRRMNRENYKKLISGLSEKELLKNLYATQLLLLIIACGLHIVIFKMRPSIYDLFKVNPIDFGIGAIAGLLVVLLDIWFMKKLPTQYNDDGGVNKKIFQNRHPLHIALIALIVAFVEEILFRGIIQTNLGIVIACLIFATLHYRYLFNPFLFINLVSVSIVISILFELTGNLWVTVIMHFLVDFILGCILRYQLFEHTKTD